MSSLQLLDAAGRRRSPATLPGHRAGHPPRNKGMRYPADPPRVEEIVAVMRQAGAGVHGARVRGLIVVLWRAGLRIAEALDLAERDLDPSRGAVLVRHGKGDRRREVGMDEWGWEQLRPWARTPHRNADRGALLRRQRAHLWAPLVSLGCQDSAPAPRRSCRRQAPLRPTSAASRPRRRDGTRGRAAQRGPTPAWTRRPRRHLRLSTRNRQHRGDQRRSLATGTDDAGKRWTTPVAGPARCSPSRKATLVRRTRVSVGAAPVGAP